MRDEMKYLMTCVSIISLFICAGWFSQEANAAELSATLSNITGTADLIRVGATEAIPAEEGMELNVGDIVSTETESFVTVTFLPKTYVELASDSELKIIRNQLDEITSTLNTRVDILSGHISKAVLHGLPPESLFEIGLSDFLPLEAEAFHTPEELSKMRGVSTAERPVAEGEELTIEIGNVVGTVEVIKGLRERKSSLASEGMMLTAGDTVKTGKDSSVTVSFLPWAYIELSANSELQVIRYRFSSPLNTRVDILHGDISKAVLQNLPPGSMFEIVLLDYLALEVEPFPEEPIILDSINPFGDPVSE